MHDTPYRSCPVCNKRMKFDAERQEAGYTWKVYDCSNCGTHVWIVPFKQLLDRKPKRKSVFRW